MLRVGVTFCIIFICLELGFVNANFEQEHEERINLETAYLEHLESYIKQVEKKQANIIRFLSYVDVVHDDLAEPQEYFGNPLNAFTTINRFVNNWQHEVINVILDNSELKEHHTQLNNQIEENDLVSPTEDDLLDATSQVIRFQDDMSTSDMAKAVIYTDFERNKNITLSASECFAIGRALHKVKFYDFAAEWLMEAKSLLSHDSPSFSSVEKVEILEEQAAVLQKLGSYKLANKVNNELLKADPKHKAALKNKIIIQNQLTLSRISDKLLKVEL